MQNNYDDNAIDTGNPNLVSVRNLAKQLESTVNFTNYAEYYGAKKSYDVQRSAEDNDKAKATLEDHFKNRSSTKMVMSEDELLKGRRSSTNQAEKTNMAKDNASERPSVELKVEKSRVDSSIANLKETLQQRVTAHNKLRAKATGSFRRTLRIKGNFMTKFGSDETILARVDGFFDKYQKLIDSSYPQHCTLASMLGTVLILLVEGRQTMLDLIEFGKRENYTTKTIMKSPVIQNLIDAMRGVEAEFGDVMVYVGNRYAMEMSSKAFSSVRIKPRHGNHHRGEAEESLAAWEKTKQDAQLPSIVEAPLILLRDRMEPFQSAKLSAEAAKLLRGLAKVEKTARSFYLQGYDDIVILLFVAEAVGKTANDSAQDTKTRQALFSPLCDVFANARANAWAALKGHAGLDLSAL